MINPLLCCDVYKMEHMHQYPSNIDYLYSYLHTRRKDKYEKVMFFGLQYYIEKYLSPFITQIDIDEFIFLRGDIVGYENPNLMRDSRENLQKLLSLGYWPIKICSVREGSIHTNPAILMTVENTVPGFHWVVGMLESLLLKIWNTCTVATYSLELKNLLAGYNEKTSDSVDFMPFQIHDFGYRGCSSEETAALSGCAHLINFLGTDTVPAVDMAIKYYDAKHPVGLSVPATEHSVMMCYGEDEIGAFESLMAIYPKGPLSIVCDTYDLFNCINSIGQSSVNESIRMRDGKIIFRPDSGNPELILLGNPDADCESERMGAYRLLDHYFGHTINNKGFKVLNPKIGVIYGDAMYFERINRILSRLEEIGYSSDNFVAGVGGLLLQQHTRDDMSFSMKVSEVTYSDGTTKPLVKKPKTDPSKNSIGGRFKGLHITYENGKINRTTFSQIKNQSNTETVHSQTEDE